MVMQFPFQLRSDVEFDVVGFGTNAVDYLIRVPEFPRYDTKIEISSYSRQAGGEIASTMAGLQRLGLRTAYAGRFGDDELGESGRSSLLDEGVDLHYAATAAGTSTQVGFIIIDQTTGERTVLWQREGGLAYSADDAPIPAAAKCKVLHVTPHDIDACIAMAKAATAAGVIVSLDIDNNFPGVGELLPLVDIFSAAPRLVTQLTGKKGADALAEIQRRYGCPVACMTLGRDGSIALCGGKVIETDGFEVPGGCVDTTGAGDAFRVGLLYGLLSGAAVDESFRMANAVAALKCRGIGARSALPDKQELTAFLDLW
jgi:sugar/nucleoside kinase (ribokinase family)